jgi:uncharacterized iron-regulated protein
MNIRPLLLLAFTNLFLSQSFSANSKQAFTTVRKQLYLAGESHLDDDIRREFTNDLELFQALGGEVLALEMVETNHQKELDDYSENLPESTENLWAYLDRRWQYNTDSYMAMIERARELGLSLLAIDLPKAQRPKEVALLPVPPDSSLVRAAREAHMAEILCANKKKAVLLIGAIHIQDRFLPEALFRECYSFPYSFKL